MDFLRYIGVPWKMAGRTFDGADCWGLVWLFYKHELGIELRHYNDAYGDDYGADTSGRKISNEFDNWRRIDQPSAGDVAVLRRAGHNCHVGIVAPRRHLLHVESAAAPSVLSPIDGAMKRRIVGTYRWRG